MKNPILTADSIVCPDMFVKCALEKMLKEQTKIDLSFDEGIITVTVNGVTATVDIDPPVPVPVPVPIPTPV